MGFVGDESTGGARQGRRLIVVWSLLLMPLVTAYEHRFCEDYFEMACQSTEVYLTTEIDPLCKCFINYTDDLCCNFDRKESSLDAVRTAAYKSVFLSNASSVTFTPLCGTPQKVTFDKVNDAILLHNEAFTGLQCLVDFKAVDTSVENALSYRKVELYSSSIKKIADSTVLTSLVLDHSQAETIENLTMSAASLDPTECLSFDNSDVSNLSYVVVMCDAHIDKTKIKQISGVNLHRSRISSSEIEEVLSDGLTLQHGWHKMINVTIKHLREKALVFEAYTKVDLHNLEIIQCDMPCILSRTEFVHFTNLIINGIKIDDIADTNYIEVTEYQPRTQFGSNSSMCNTVGNYLKCLGDTASMYKAMEFQPDFSIPVTMLSNFALSLGLTSHCFQVLKLEELNGWIRNLRPAGDYDRDDCPYKDRRIVIKDCKRIDYLQSDYLDQLDVDNSEIEFLDISTELSKVDMSHVKIHDLENMRYASRSGVKSDFNLKSVTISSLYNLVLKSPGLMTDFKVMGRVSNFTLDTSREATTTIRGGMMRLVTARGIHIQSGILALDNVQIREMGYGAITIDHPGRLLIIPSAENLEPFVCEKGPRIIAQRKSQVAFLFPIHKPHWLRDCTLTRGDDLEDMEYLKSKYARFVTPQDCIVDTDLKATCDMRNAQGPTLLGGTSALDSAVTVAVTGVANLTVGDHCFDSVALDGVRSAAFMDIKHSCYFKLNLADTTSILNVVNNIYELRVIRSLIKRLAPSTTVMWAAVGNSTIRSFSATIREGVFLNVTIKDIAALKVLKAVVFINCTVTKFFKGSVEVQKGAILRFTNCSINMMSAKSFIVRGSLLMKNVTINLAANETLSIDKDASVTMKGVYFQKEVSNLFSIDSPPRILLDKVKMDNIPVKLDRQFDVAISYLNGTIVGQGHRKNAAGAIDESGLFSANSVIVISFCSVVITALIVFIGTRLYTSKRQNPTVDRETEHPLHDMGQPGTVSGTPEAPGDSNTTTFTNVPDALDETKNSGQGEGSPGLSQGGPSLSQGGPSLSQGGPSLSQGGPSLSQGSPGLSQGSPGLSHESPGLSQGGPGLSQGSPGLSQGGPGLSQGSPGSPASTKGKKEVGKKSPAHAAIISMRTRRDKDTGASGSDYKPLLETDDHVV